MKSCLFFLVFLFIYNISLNAQENKPPKEKDDPIKRALYEYNLLKNPYTNKIPDNIRAKELEFVSRIRKKSLKATSWSHRGPFNVGGRTRALAIDINNEDIILAGGVSGGMWRSTDGGVSWVKTTGSAELHSVTSIVQDTTSGNTNTWYYTTGEYSGNSAGETGAPFRGDGLYKSTDNGITWTKIASTSTGNPQTYDSNFNYCWTVKINPVNNDVYVATYGKIYSSSNGGTDWTEAISGGVTDVAGFSDIEISESGVLYATFSNNDENEGVLRSTDGVNWVNITPVGFPTSFRRIVLDIAPSNENVVYFLANSPGAGQNDHVFWKYTYISGDGTGVGGNWEERTVNLPNEGEYTGDFDSQGSYDLLVQVKPDDENFVVIGGVNLNRSTDGFSTSTNNGWIGGYTASNNSYGTYRNHHPDQHSFVFLHSDPKIVFSGNDGGVQKCMDVTASESETALVSWTSLNNGYLTTQSYAIAIDQENFYSNHLMSGFQDNGTWGTTLENSTANWFEEGSGDGCFCEYGEFGFSRYPSVQNGKIYRNVYNESGNVGWTRVDPNGASGQLFVNPFILDKNNSNVMYYCGGNKIWRNSNLTEIPLSSSSPATKNWVALENSSVSGTITALAVSKEPSDVLVYGTSNGEIFKIENARTGDPTPTNITGSNFPNGNIGSLLINPNNAMEMFAVFTNYEVISVWRTTDGGTSWESISGNLEENVDGTGNGPSVRWIEMLKMQGEDPIYFVGTSTGLYSTTTLSGNSTAWVQEGADIIGNVVVTMVRTRDDGIVAVGTHGNGIYSTTYSSSAVSNPEFISASTADATKVILSFSKEMESPSGRHRLFTVNTGADNPAISVKYKPADATSYELTLENPIPVGAAISVSYSPGNIKSLDGGILQAFSTNVDNTVDVKKVAADIPSEVKIYPNPSNGQFRVELNSGDGKAKSVIFAMYNMSGQLIYFSKEDNITNMIRDINISNHPKGVYNLEIVEGGQAKNYKVMVK